MTALAALRRPEGTLEVVPGECFGERLVLLSQDRSNCGDVSRSGYSSLNVHRTTIRNKAAILQDLAKLNIKSSSIYPGIEKATVEIAKKHELAVR
ncbi:hypothetical protein EHI44_29605 [Rhizobium leguminosarum]|nr:hypothetical protein EHI44_29605 [Rhizobium leguminosarum]